MDFWDEVRAGWAAAEDAVLLPQNRPEVLMKPLRRYSVRKIKVPIAITGHSGSGKTTLYNTLTGKTSSTSDSTVRSQSVEKHRTYIRTPSGVHRAEAHVPPGQASEQRSRALEEIMFEGRRYPSGVVHAVNWGYNTVWPEELQGAADGIRAAGDPITLASVVKRNLRNELDTFEDVCTRLKRVWRNQRDIWLIVVVAKSDLFWPDRGAARDYYIPAVQGPDSDFAVLLKDLVNSVGENHFKKVAVIPFACRLDTFRFGIDVSADPSIYSTETSALVNNFLSVLGEVL